MKHTLLVTMVMLFSTFALAEKSAQFNTQGDFERPAISSSMYDFLTIAEDLNLLSKDNELTPTILVHVHFSTTRRAIEPNTIVIDERFWENADNKQKQAVVLNVVQSVKQMQKMDRRRKH